MDYQTIDEIYEANDRFRDRLSETIDSLTADEINVYPHGEKWSIEEILEHVSIVEEGMGKICRKLLAKADEDDMKSSGEISISDVFRAYADSSDDIKLVAPERVWPTGERSISDSKAKMTENRTLFETLRPLFKEIDGTNHSFPHPYFGPLSAQEWLVLSGEHMARHTRQIQKIVEKIRQ